MQNCPKQGVAMKNIPHRKLEGKGIYAITDNAYYHNLEQLEHQVTAALQGGISILQYRNKTALLEQKEEEVSVLKKLCRYYNVPLIINDDVSLAQQFQLGVHLGRQDGDIEQARAKLGKNVIIGATCHQSIETAQELEHLVDYVAFGACFPSRTKPNTTLLNHKVLKDAKNALACKIIAIGGIDLHNARSIIDYGVDYIACIAAIWSAKDIEKQCQKLTALFL